MPRRPCPHLLYRERCLANGSVLVGSIRRDCPHHLGFAIFLLRSRAVPCKRLQQAESVKPRQQEDRKGKRVKKPPQIRAPVPHRIARSPVRFSPLPIPFWSSLPASSAIPARPSSPPPRGGLASSRTTVRSRITVRRTPPDPEPPPPLQSSVHHLVPFLHLPHHYSSTTPSSSCVPELRRSQGNRPQPKPPQILRPSPASTTSRGSRPQCGCSRSSCSSSPPPPPAPPTTPSSPAVSSR